MKEPRKHRLPILILLISFFYLLPIIGQAAELEDSMLNYQGNGTFQLETEDLLAKFKGVMPGDKVRQKLTIKNDSDKEVEISLSIVSTDPIDLAFLEQLNLTLSHGAKVLYSGSIHQMTEKSGTLLGEFKVGQDEEYYLDLTVPLSLDNQFNGYLTTSEWTFVATDKAVTPPVKPEPTNPTEPTKPEPVPAIPTASNKVSPTGYSRLPQMGTKESWQVIGMLLLILAISTVGMKQLKKSD